MNQVFSLVWKCKQTTQVDTLKFFYADSNLENQINNGEWIFSERAHPERVLVATHWFDMFACCWRAVLEEQPKFSNFAFTIFQNFHGRLVSWTFRIVMVPKRSCSSYFSWQLCRCPSFNGYTVGFLWCWLEATPNTFGQENAERSGFVTS